MNSSLQLQLGSTVVNFSAHREELTTAISHIYQPFLVSPQNKNIRKKENQAFADSIGDVSCWKFSVDDETFELEEFDWALRTLEDAIADRLLVAVSDCLLIHSGAVGNSSCTYLIVGQSGSGKTTTTLEFVRRGYQYLTDEFAAIEQSGAAIRPFPRTATRKFESPTPEGSAIKLPEDLGFRSHMLPENRAALEPRPLRSCRIIFPRHSSDARPKARLLDSAEVCSRLMPSIFDFEGREKILWPTLANLVTSSQACELDYKSAQTDLDLALNLFD